MSDNGVPDLVELPSVMARSNISGSSTGDGPKFSSAHQEFAPKTAGTVELKSRIAEKAKDRFGDVSSSDEEDPADDFFGEEDEVLQPDPVCCFFCNRDADLPDVILEHCKSEHGCDLAAWVKKRLLPTEDIVKMVNFIRKTHPTPSSFSDKPSASGADPASWSADDYMMPVCAEDHGITSLLIWDWSEPDLPAEPFPAPVKRQQDMDIPSLMAGGDSVDNSDQCRDRDDARNVDYFDSYSGFNIHCEMLRDKVRTETYREAINAVVRGKDVLDIGCGSGVLSCFAARAGAKRVVAVDKADIIEHAHDIARANGLEKLIQFVHGDLDRVKLPVDKVDVIVSEWMGYFLLFEGMLDSVIAARDKYLSPTGTLIPSSASLYLTALSDEEDWKTTVGFWGDAYGLKFDCLRRHTLRYPSVHAADPTAVVSSTITLRAFDLMKCRVEDLDFSTETTFTPIKSCNITALVGFFDVGYDVASGEHKVMFCTSPADTTTHWAQSVFYLDKVFPVEQGLPVSLTADIRKTRDDKRGLTVTFHLKNSAALEWKQTYEL
ncbi:Protein arginine N-methyltransferase 3 [Hypsibius exemplaris]|uniref:type I protein arginine methyltransferase n=1 Tax=Hypsibius exemplaris TaxID=2072580 RepID=A0A1W0X508_HYPEX|nr:Protein arginine N-methyltransferase 3 [Hypsibius exemplaris]